MSEATTTEFRIVGLPQTVDTDELEVHVEHVLDGVVSGAEYRVSKKKCLIAILSVETDKSLASGAQVLRRSRLPDGTRLNVEPIGGISTAAASTGTTNKRNKATLAKEHAMPFYEYLKRDAIRLERASDREEVGVIFQEYCRENDVKHSIRLESLLVSRLRQLKLMKSKRYGNIVAVRFALGEPGDFVQERKTRDVVLEKMRHQEEDKHGVIVSAEAKGLLNAVPTNSLADFSFSISCDSLSMMLQDVTIVGPQKRAFDLLSAPELFPMKLSLSGDNDVNFSFASSGIGLYRCGIRMRFVDTEQDLDFVVVRFLAIRSGDEAMNAILKPTAPYEKKKKRHYEKQPTEVIGPPKVQKREGSSNPLKLLPHHKIPSEIHDLLMNGELEYDLEKPETDVSLYAKFWKELLWASEYQAYEDIKLYGMENVPLKREGRFMVLYVPGLAEGRPSVLRGDLVNLTWKGRLYKGRVHQTRLLDVLLELDGSFHRRFSNSLDTVDVRFTFSRTTFRTSHEGCLQALEHMGEQMLVPRATDRKITIDSRRVPSALQWANRSLNDEQRVTVSHIVKGSRRPMPYIVFGPPGTGKTTTVVEAVYQLVRNDESLNILLVAPSNDAADILVEKLSSYFPSSEMKRVIAYSRSIEQVSSAVRPYVTEGLTDSEMATEIMSSRIVVSTINLAARFPYYGVPRGHFGVLCVDEAGHATEPEVIGVAASLMDFSREDTKAGQLILAGDPKQLGPVITSDLCQKFGLSVSYMERLTTTDAYARNEESGSYPPGLLTKLVRTYRSHPAILKLPNEMFYDNELVACGDVLSTHSLAKWEHLPQKEFPIIFHAVNGENLREGSSPSWFNREEAQQAVSYVDLLVNQSRPAVQPQDIGIITPYARQAQKIRQLLKHCGFSDDIKVGSVETFQGQERRCIIISTVRAESDLLSVDRKYNLGFVSNEKRFNVAVTRAKSLLIVVGSPSVLATDSKTWLPFLRYCKENNAWMGQPWDESDVEATDSDSSFENDDEWQLIHEDGVSQAVAQEGLGYINREE